MKYLFLFHRFRCSISISVEEQKMNKMNAFFVWIMLNVLLPVSPLAIKASMNFFSNEEINKIAVLDGIELIYYNLF